ncbi:MAG: hypothetical protein IJA32_15360 [Lachnospiraceae bacterium]|nr:hypothetical protein [Lachnospiraceae bacterium]
MKKKGVWAVLVAVMVGSISLTCMATGMQQEEEKNLPVEVSGSAEEGTTIDLSAFCNDVSKSQEFYEFMKGLDESVQKTLVIPEGQTLVLNHYFTLPSNTTLQGGAIEFTTDAQYADVYNEAFIINRHSETYWDGEKDKNIRIQNVDIRYDCSNQGRSLLRFRDITGLVVTECNIQVINQQKSTTSHNAAIDLFKGCTDVELSNNQIYLDNPNGSAGGAIWIRSMAVENNDPELLKTSNVRVTGNVITSNSCDELLAVGSSGYDTSDVLISNNTFIRLDGSKKNLMLGVCPAIGGSISNVIIKNNKFLMNNTTAIMNKEILRIGGVLDTNQYAFILTGIEIIGNEITGNLAGSKAIVVKKEETNSASVLLRENTIKNTGSSSEGSYGIIATGPNVLADNVIEGVETAYATDEETVWNDSKKEENIAKVFNSVQEMKSYTGSELREGAYVRTTGYYANGDGGGALYLISENTSKKADDRKVIELANGYRAILTIENDTVNVKQFGAKGDGVTDDHDAVNAAVTSGAKTIQFPKGEYKIDDLLYFTDVDGITIEGNGSVLFTDDDYRKDKDYEEHFITFSGSNTKKLSNLTIKNLKIEAREQLKSSSDQKYKNQMAFKYVDQVLVEGCEFTIPETVTALMPSKKIEYSILDLYVDWSNVTVKDCSLINKAGTGYGVCVQFRDIWNGGCENAEFYNNYLYSNCKDEIIAIFSNEASKSHVNNVNIHDNEIIADRCELGRDICITVGYDNSYQCDNIQIHDNKITGVSDWAFFTLGKTLTNSKIYNNEIIMKVQDSGSGNPLAGITRAVCTSDTNEVSDNNITIESYEGIGLDVVFDGNCNYIGNTVVSNELVNRVFSGDCYVVENDITVNGNVAEIGYNAAYVKNNDIVVKGTLTKTGFNYYGSTWKKDYQVLENRITIEGTPASTFIHLNTATLNGNQFIFEKNVIITPNCKENGKLLYLSLLDTTPQTIYLLENEQGIYQGESRYANKAEHLVLYERNKEEQPSDKEEEKEENKGEEEKEEEKQEEKQEEEKQEESSEKENTTEENKDEKLEETDKGEEGVKETITTEEVKTEEKNQGTSQQISTREENTKQESQTSTSKSTRKEPFNEEDTKKDPFTVADTVKPNGTKNDGETNVSNQTIIVEDSANTYMEAENKTNAGTSIKVEEVTEKETETANQEKVDIESKEEILKESEVQNSKDDDAEYRKILIILGILIVIALGAGILIIFKK